jgi:hypothetical protein
VDKGLRRAIKSSSAEEKQASGFCRPPATPLLLLDQLSCRSDCSVISEDLDICRFSNFGSRSVRFSHKTLQRLTAKLHRRNHLTTPPNASRSPPEKCRSSRGKGLLGRTSRCRSDWSRSRPRSSSNMRASLYPWHSPSQLPRRLANAQELTNVRLTCCRLSSMLTVD